MSHSRQIGTIRRRSVGGSIPPVPVTPAEEAALAIIAAVSPTPSAGVQAEIRAQVLRMMNSGEWDDTDVIYAASTKLVNWKLPGGAYDAVVETGSAIYTPAGAFLFDGTWNLNSNWAPDDVVGAKFTRNDHHQRLYSQTSQPDAGDGFDFGNTRNLMKLHGATGDLRVRSANTNSVINTALKCGAEMIEAHRRDSTGFEIYRNDEIVQTVVAGDTGAGSVAFASHESFRIGKNSSNATKGSKIIALVTWGKSKNAAQIVASNAGWETYLAAVGAIGSYNLAYGTIIYTGRNGNSFKITRTGGPNGTNVNPPATGDQDGPYRSDSLVDYGRGRFKCKVRNGDRSGSTLHERCELIGQGTFAWGENLYFKLKRKVIHWAPSTKQAIATQINDEPPGDPSFTLQIAGNASHRGQSVDVGWDLIDGSSNGLHYPPDPSTGRDVNLDTGKRVDFRGRFKTGHVTRGETGIVEVYRQLTDDGEATWTKIVDHAASVGNQETNGTLNSVKFKVGIYSTGVDVGHSPYPPAFDDGVTDSVIEIEYSEFEYGSTPYPVI